MRLLVCALFTLIFLTSSVTAQGLDANAAHIKKTFPNAYQDTIRKHAVSEWGDDFTMVVYEINKQADALVELINTFKSENTDIAFRAIQEWSLSGHVESNIERFRAIDSFDLKSLVVFQCDWSMVKYEYDKQLEAKNSF